MRRLIRRNRLNLLASLLTFVLLWGGLAVLMTVSIRYASDVWLKPFAVTQWSGQKNEKK